MFSIYDVKMLTSALSFLTRILYICETDTDQHE